jgi:tellurite resistance protein TerC
MGLWVGFGLLVLVLLVLDLGVFHRGARVVTLRGALVRSGVWIGVALAFNGLVYVAYERHWFGLDLPDTEPDGRAAAVMFLTGYLVEKSLGVDNLFVIAMIFGRFGIPPAYQHRALFWGIVGALIMRAVMILAGAALLERLHGVLYVFGAFLVVTGLRMAVGHHPPPDPSRSPVIRWARRWMPVTEDLADGRFVARIEGARRLTPLALALIMIETSDLMFAVDSIPAIFAITDEPFLVFTSNIMAVLGLRSLYFALVGIIDRLHYLRLSLALLLALIGAKMLLSDVLDLGPETAHLTLGAVALVLGAGVVASLVRARREPGTWRVDVPVRSTVRVRGVTGRSHPSQEEPDRGA